jgi:lipoate-protein ligase B
VAAEIWCVRAGQVPYAYAREAQHALAAARHAGRIPDVLLLLEHPRVYTKGRRSTADELPMGEDWYRMQGIDVVETDRGGRVTYHGPGQLVAYPIVNLGELANRDDVHDYIRRMERTMIASLGDWGVEAGTIEGQTGVWTPPAGTSDEVAGQAAKPAAPRASQPADTGREAEDVGGLVPEDVGGVVPRKIGSIGVHVSRGVTTHGLAINVNNDLQPFEWIVPCGIESCRMTSLSRELGAEQDIHRFATTVRERFGEIYERDPVDMHPAQIGELVEGAGAFGAAEPTPVP